MKQTIKTLLPVHVDIDMDTVQRILFKFTQGQTKKLLFAYPSDKAILTDDGNINLVWENEETAYFDAGSVYMDTHIELKDSDINPETRIQQLTMCRSLFTVEEVQELD